MAEERRDTSPSAARKPSDGGGSSRRRRSRRRRNRRSSGGDTPSAPVEVSGHLYRQDDGRLIILSRDRAFRSAGSEPVVETGLVDRLHLEGGLLVEGRAHSHNGRQKSVFEISSIEGMAPDEYRAKAMPFADLVSIDPTERLSLEADGVLETRVVELVAPIGKGQRCLIVAPPKAGKTTLLQQLAHAIAVNHPEVTIFVLLVDERPEEVTDWKRNVVRGEVVASSSDESVQSHIEVSEVLLERARRLVELGQDVVLLMDSLTRMSRAYNNAQKGSGRILSGGIDARTMEKPRRFFGSARNIEGGGSLTIIATCLIDTGSRMDEVIFQEFKGTGNMEIVMSRDLFERRIFPSISISESGTRKEEKLYSREKVEKIYLLRRALASLSPHEAMQLLLSKLKQFPSNDAFLAGLQAQAGGR